MIKIQLIQSYATHEVRNPSHVAQKERESSHNPDPYIQKMSAASRQELLTCQLSRDLLKARQSKYPKSKTDDRFQLSRSCNKKDPVEHAPPKFQLNLHSLRCQKLLARGAFVSPVLNQYHSQYSIYAVSPATDTPTRQPYVLQQSGSGVSHPSGYIKS